MLSVFLIRMIENHAEDLTREVLNDLATNPRTPHLHAVSREELHRRAYDLFKNLGEWLSDRDDAHIENPYARLGRDRHIEGVTLSEVIYAVILIKEHLRNYVRRAGAASTALELYQEVELNLMIGHFFDRALYHTVKGYEAARAATSPTVARHAL